MTDVEQLYTRLREADPATGLDDNPHGPRAQRIKQQAIQRAETSTAPRRGMSRTRVVASVAVATTLVGTVAVASGMFEPDADEVAAILDEARDSGREAVKTDSWRPTLRTEQIWCAYDSGIVGTTRTFEFSLDEPMHEQHLIAACTEGPDQHRASGAPSPSDFTLCEAYASTAEARRAIDEPQRWRLLEGTVTTDRPRFPVVLGWAADCSDVTVDTNAPAVELRDWTTATMEATNRAREYEISLTAAAVEQCLTLDQAHEMARHTRTQLSGDWPILEQNFGADSCRRVWIDPQLGVLEIGPRT